MKNLLPAKVRSFLDTAVCAAFACSALCAHAQPEVSVVQNNALLEVSVSGQTDGLAGRLLLVWDETDQGGALDDWTNATTVITQATNGTYEVGLQMYGVKAGDVCRIFYCASYDSLIDYIGSSRAQVLDTGYLADETSAFEIDLLFSGERQASSSEKGQSNAFFGYADATLSHVYSGQTDESVIYANFPNETNDFKINGWINSYQVLGLNFTQIPSNEADVKSRNVYRLAPGEKATLGSLQSANSATALKKLPKTSVALFGVNTTKGLYPFYQMEMRVYGMKIYEGTDLVRNFSPAVLDDKYGLWDAVTGRFAELQNAQEEDCAEVTPCAHTYCHSEAVEIAYIHDLSCKVADTSIQVSVGHGAQTHRPLVLCWGEEDGGDVPSAWAHTLMLTNDIPFAGGTWIVDKQANGIPEKELCRVLVPASTPAFSYLESTGTEYVDLDVCATSDLSVDMTCLAVKNGTSEAHAIFGLYESSGSAWAIWYWRTLGHFFASYPRDTDLNAGGISNAVRIVLEPKKATIWYADQGELKSKEFSTSTAFNAPANQPLYLFTMNRITSGTAAPDLNGACSRIMSFVLKRGDVVLRDLVPSEKGGEYCLFDRATGDYLMNRGTGAFRPGESLTNVANLHVAGVASLPARSTSPTGLTLLLR